MTVRTLLWLAIKRERRRRGLSPFPKQTNRHVDHNHDYYDLNQSLHFAAS